MKVSSDAADGRPLRHPQDQAAADRLADGEQLQLLAEHAVVALLRLLELVQVGVEVLLGEEGGAVEPLELLAGGVVLPVGAGDAQQLERADLAGVRDVRPAAQVDELALAVEAQRSGTSSARRRCARPCSSCFRSAHELRGPRRSAARSARTARPSSTIFFISASMRGKSSSRIGVGESMS